LPTFAAQRVDNYNDLLQASKKGRTKGIFGVDEPLSWKVANGMISDILDDLGSQRKVVLHSGMSDEPIPRGKFILALSEALYPSEAPKPITTAKEKIAWAYRKLSPFLKDACGDPTGAITRGEALEIAMRALTGW